MKTEKRTNKKTLIKLFLDLGMIIAFFAVLYSGINIYRIHTEYRAGKDSYKEIIDKIYQTDISAKQSNRRNLRKQYFPILKKMNSDFIGWIYMENSAIDYPFVQTDNNNYYLFHLFNKEYNRSGCVFLDSDNHNDFSDKNTVLYAHHMKNGTMFHDIVNFKEQEYYDTHKIIEIDTLYDSYDYYPIAGKFTDGYDDYIQISFSDEEDFNSYINSFLTDSTFVSDESLSSHDQIVLLSTCAYNVSDGRYALIGKLVKRTEKE